LYRIFVRGLLRAPIIYGGDGSFQFRGAKMCAQGETISDWARIIIDHTRAEHIIFFKSKEAHGPN
jgi:hypothetical protein